MLTPLTECEQLYLCFADLPRGSHVSSLHDLQRIATGSGRTEYKEYEFRIGGKNGFSDQDGYLSVWKNHGIPSRHNIPMLARFKVGNTQNGELITPSFYSWEVRAFYNPLDDNDDPEKKHYSFEYFGASNPHGKYGDQGDIPGRFLDYATEAKTKYGLTRGKVYNPWEGLTEP